MFHKQKDGFQASWVLAIHVRSVRWGMRAGSDQRVVGVMLPRPRLGRHPSGSRKSSGNIRAQHVSVREEEMEAWGGNICQQLQRRINPIVSVRYAEKRQGHDVNSTSWSKLPSPPPPSLPLPGFGETSRASAVHPSQSADAGRGRGTVWYAFCQRVIWQTHPPSWLHSAKQNAHTHTHTNLGEVAGQEGGGNLIYKSDTCPNNWVSTDLCLCY